jgi:hemerythrin
MCGAIRHARRHLCSRIRETVEAADPDFVRAFPAIVAAVEASFRQEETMLEALGDGQMHAHRAENATLLCALHRVLPQVEAGDLALGRQVLGALRDVLALHHLSAGLVLAAGARSARLRGRPVRIAGPVRHLPGHLRQAR